MQPPLFLSQEGIFMEIEAVFCDMDGTFLTSRKTIPAENKLVVGRLAEKGIAFIPCTGRMYTGLPDFFLNSHTVGCAICSMGATVIEFEEGRIRSIFEGGISKEIVKNFYSCICKLDIEFDVFAHGRSYAERRRLERIGLFSINPGMMGFIKRQRVPIDIDMITFMDGLDRIERLNIYYRSVKDGKSICALIDTIPELSYTRHDGCGLEVTSAELSKGTALTWLCKKKGIDPRRTIAFGDGENDIAMFGVAGISVAMKNAEDLCKRNADYVSEWYCDHAGVARFLSEKMV